MDINKKITSSVVLSAITVTQCGLLESHAASNNTGAADNLLKKLAGESGGGVDPKGSGKNSAGAKIDKKLRRKIKLNANSNAPQLPNTEKVVIDNKQATQKPKKDVSSKVVSKNTDTATSADSSSDVQLVKNEKSGKKRAVTAFKDGDGSSKKVKEQKNKEQQVLSSQKSGDASKKKDKKSEVAALPVDEKKDKNLKVTAEPKKDDSEKLRKNVKKEAEVSLENNNEVVSETGESVVAESVKKEDSKVSQKSKEPEVIQNKEGEPAEETLGKQKQEANKNDDLAKKEGEGVNLAEEPKEESVVSDEQQLDKDKDDEIMANDSSNNEFDEFDEFDEFADEDDSSQKDIKSKSFFSNMSAEDIVLSTAGTGLAGYAADKMFNNGKIASAIGNGISNFIFDTGKGDSGSDSGSEPVTPEPSPDTPEPGDSKKEVGPLVPILNKFYNISFIPPRLIETLANGEVAIPVPGLGSFSNFFGTWFQKGVVNTVNSKNYGELLKDWFDFGFNPIKRLTLYWFIFSKVLVRLPEYFVRALIATNKSLIKGANAFEFILFNIMMFLLIYGVYRAVAIKFPGIRFNPVYTLCNYIGRYFAKAFSLFKTGSISSPEVWRQFGLGFARFFRDLVRIVTNPAWQLAANVANFGKSIYYSKKYGDKYFTEQVALRDGFYGLGGSAVDLLLPVVYYGKKLKNFFNGSDAMKLLSYVNEDGTESIWAAPGKHGIDLTKPLTSETALTLNGKFSFFGSDGKINASEILDYALIQMQLKLGTASGEIEKNYKLDEKFLEFIMAPSVDFGDWIGRYPKRFANIHKEVVKKIVELLDSDKEGNEKNETNKKIVEEFLKDKSAYGVSLKDWFRLEAKGLKEPVNVLARPIIELSNAINFAALQGESVVDFVNEVFQKDAVYEALRDGSNANWYDKFIHFFERDGNTNGLNWLPKFKYINRRVFLATYYENKQGNDIAKVLKDALNVRLSKLSGPELVAIYREMKDTDNGTANEFVCNHMAEKLDELKGNSDFEAILSKKLKGGEIKDILGIMAHIKKNLALKKLIALKDDVFFVKNFGAMFPTQEAVNNKFNGNKCGTLLKMIFGNKNKDNNYQIDINTLKFCVNFVKSNWKSKNELLEEINKSDEDFKVNENLGQSASFEDVILQIDGKDLIPGTELSAKNAADLLAQVRALDGTNVSNFKEGGNGESGTLFKNVNKYLTNLGYNAIGDTRRDEAAEALKNSLNNFVSSKNYTADIACNELESLAESKNWVAFGELVNELANAGAGNNIGEKLRKLIVGNNKQGEQGEQFRKSLEEYFYARDLSDDSKELANDADVIAYFVCNRDGIFEAIKSELVQDDKLETNELLNKVVDYLKTKIDGDNNDLSDKIKPLIRIVVGEKCDKFFEYNIKEYMDKLKYDALNNLLMANNNMHQKLN